MKISLVFVPPGGGEADYGLDVEMPSVPPPGDYITILREDQTGTADFIVRRSWWYLTADSRPTGSTKNVTVECEFARGPTSSDDHKRNCDMYDRRGKKATSFEASAY